MSDSTPHDLPDGIAVIGMSGRFPGADTIDHFWRNLCDGVESISFFSEQELVDSGVNPAYLAAPNFIKAGRTLNDVETFDAAFFGYAPREAELIDPQHRLFLECAWEALEQAGYDPETYKGWIGVYGGVALNGYLLYNLFANPEIRDFLESSVQGTTANDRDYVTTRVSYKLNLRGPSFNVQSACSTSLVAVHLACQSLMSYQGDMALAGGAAVRVPQKAGYLYQEGGMYSPDGHCRTFDAQAGGTVFGSGVGVVVLKRLADALADGDTIFAVIKGSAVNNDGSMKVGFTAPAMEGQAEVIAMAQGVADVDPETVSYVEAHGTATPLGDPIEIAALTKVFGARTQKKQFCAVGSVKTNIGHASAASGIIGLIKTVLALKHRQIPPSLYFEQPNPKIEFANSPFYVNTRLSEWKTNGFPRRAGVSSFGVGGTNAHIVLEEAPPVDPSGPSRPWQLLLLSARTDTALEAATTNLVEHLKRHPDLDLADVAYTLQVGRRSFGQRRMLVCRDLDDAISALEARDPKRVLTLFREQIDRPVTFMFSGQGAQYVHMAHDLYRTERVFREQVDRCAELLIPHLGLDLREVLYPDDRRPGDKVTRRQGDKVTGEQERYLNLQSPISNLQSPDESETQNSKLKTQNFSSGTQLDETWLTQPALFVIEYALAQLWMAWGVHPRAMIGHSIGEYVAACLAGVFSLEDALMLVAARGRLMQQVPPGTMLSVPLTEQDVQPLLGSQLSLAAINGPSRCIVAGPAGAVDELERRLAEAGVDTRRLHTSHAFHSWMMEPILDMFTRQVQRVPLRPPAIPYVSNLTGTWITAEEATNPQYWARHLRQTVRFAEGARTLLQEPERILLEVGPGQTLSTLVRQHPDKTARHTVLASLRHPQDQQSDIAFALSTLGQLWLAGLRVDWRALYVDERRRHAILPTYPFERQRYWIDPPRPDQAAKKQQAALYKQPNIADWFSIPSWKRSAPPVREPGDLGEAPLCWLVLSDSIGLGPGLARQLVQEGQDVVIVTIGERFGKLDERLYCIDPRRPEDYDALLDELRTSKLAPRMIAHLWSVTADDRGCPREAMFENAQEMSFNSLLFLAQAIGRQQISEPLHMVIVSNNMQQVIGGDLLAPEKALLLGPCKTIPAEYPNIACQSVDILLPPPGSIAEQELIDQLIAEFAARSTDLVIAYRGYDRWVQTFEPIHLAEAIAEKSRLRERGVYLITGGMGGLGLVFADYLARAARARLVLTSLSAFPTPQEWDGWLDTHDEQDGISTKIRKLRELEALGAEVMVISVNAADEAPMRAAVARIDERFGAIHGVIHAAGFAGGGLIQLKTPEMAARVLAPKFQGIRSLEAALADTKLDFLLLCSSITAVTGGIGRVDYCAANCFLDAYAHYNTSQRGVFTISINWDAWDEVGMAVNAAASFEQRQALPGYDAELLAHPLLHRLVREAPNRDVYLTDLNAADYWMLAEHKILGVPALPGTTYLEMARAAFAHRGGGGPIEIADVFFLTPMMVGAGEKKEVRTILEGSGDRAGFRVMSRPASHDGAEGQWQEHVRGQVGAIDAPRPERRSLEELRDRCGAREVLIDEAESTDAGRLVYWGPRWRSLKKISIGADEGLGLLELPDQFAADLREFGLHPALLDVATAFAVALVGRDQSYLPLSYHRLALHGPLSKTLYSYVRYRDGAASRKETISFDIIIMDEQGDVLVEIDEFTMRRASESSGRLREATRQEQQRGAEQAVAGDGPPREAQNGAAAPSAAGAGKPGMLSMAIVPTEGVDVFKRVLSRHRLPQVVVSTRNLQGLLEQTNQIKRSRILEEIDKVQRAKPTHPRPEMKTAYIAPRNELERTLGELWQQALGTDQVGIYDNFFELGGDSVLAIQIIAKAGEAGLKLTPQQLFQNQTIAELAAAVDPEQSAQIGQDAAGDIVPLTPLQRWFFGQDLPDPHRWTQTVLLETPAGLDSARLEQAADHVMLHHDALRLRFVRGETGWRQISAMAEERPVFTYTDLSPLPDEEQAPAIEAITAEVRASLDLAHGPIARVAFLDCGHGRPGRLLLVVHHLAIDVTSWRIVLEDLWTAYEQLSRGERIALPPRTDAFAQLARRIEEYASSGAAGQELSYWRAALDAPVAPLPVDIPGGEQDNSEISVRTLTTAMSVAATAALLEEANRAYRTRIDEVLLAALVEALAPWTGERALLVSLEDQCRDGVFDDLDLSRTVGCLTTLFPLRLDLSAAAGPGDALTAIKEQRRAVPRHGLGYGALRYLCGDQDIAAQIEALPQAEVRFNFRGQAGEVLPDASPFRLVGGLAQSGRSLRGRRLYLLEVSARVEGDQLQIEWTYSEHVHRRASIERLAQEYLEILHSIVEHCQSLDESRFTPLDFPQANLSQESLDKLLNRIGRNTQ